MDAAAVVFVFLTIVMMAKNREFERADFEKSINAIIDSNNLSGCYIGVEIKDESRIVIKNSLIQNNQIGLHAYIKKPVFGPSYTRVFDSELIDNQEDVKAEDGCKIDLM